MMVFFSSFEAFSTKAVHSQRLLIYLSQVDIMVAMVVMVLQQPLLSMADMLMVSSFSWFVMLRAIVDGKCIRMSNRERECAC